jgi:glycosyltransferase involved in cell wall biosynthesis
MPEIANDAAHYSRPENIEDWISALNFAIQNEEDVKLLKVKGLERAKYFKWEHSADQVWESFEKILSNER